MNRSTTVVAVAAAAALATYFLDPDMGRRRRALVRDRMRSGLARVDDARSVAATDLRNRTRGVLAALRARWSARDVQDPTLCERVRARLGHVASHPSAIEVTANAGTVTLRGPVPSHEADRVCYVVRRVPGVREVIDQLQRHDEPHSLPALQGETRRKQQLDVLQAQWSPATRVLAGASGAALVASALGSRTPLSIVAGVAGGALLLRAGSNLPLARLFGRRGPYIHFVKTIRIAAPIDDVFTFWQNFENFPKFMRNVRSVRQSSAGTWHWEVAGPLGASVQWDARVTDCRPDELIGWATVPGAQVEHAGRVHFQREGEGTRVQVEMRYNPPGAALGHVVASLFGADPLSEMDEDLMRMKSFLETGTPARDAAVAREQRQPDASMLGAHPT